MIIISLDYIFIGGENVLWMVAYWAERDLGVFILGLFILAVLPEIDS